MKAKRQTSSIVPLLTAKSLTLFPDDVLLHYNYLYINYIMMMNRFPLSHYELMIMSRTANLDKAFPHPTMFESDKHHKSLSRQYFESLSVQRDFIKIVLTRFSIHTFPALFY